MLTSYVFCISKFDHYCLVVGEDNRASLSSIQFTRNIHNSSLIVARVKFESESSSSHESSSSQVKFSFFFLVVLFLIAV